MSGLSDKATNSNLYFKLQKDDRAGSQTLGQFRFFQQEKINGVWTATNEGNSMSGVLKALNTKTYKWKNEDKENLEVTLQGDNTDYVISFGFATGITENLLNSLCDEPIIGEIEMSCGLPKNDYPTLYITHQKQKTKWRYSKDNGNWEEVPKIVTETDADGNKIRKGVKARAEFFRKLLIEVQAKLAPLSTSEPIKANNAESAGTTPVNNTPDDSGLPF